MAENMDLAAMCEVLTATMQPEGAARKAAEQRLDEASSGSPNKLVGNLALVLAAGETTPELRQEAAVILRQLVSGSAGREPVWEELEDATKKAAMAQLLSTLEKDSSNVVKRQAGQVASAVANTVAETMPELMAEWPELLPALSRFIGGGGGGGGACRVVALEILKDLVPVFGEGLMSQGEQVIAMLSSTLADAEPEVRAAAAELTLQLVEDLDPEEYKPLTRVLPAVVAALQGFAKGSHEEQLKDTLQALVSAADEEPEFFMDAGIETVQTLWNTLVELCAAGQATFADADVRQSAMEAAMTLACGLCEDFAKPEGQAQLERLIGLNVEWMLEVEEDVDVWSSQGKEDNEDDCDDDVVEYGEQNLDRLAEKFDEEVFMPLLFKLIRAAGLAPTADWKHARASVMAVSQVVEHLEEDAWVDQCVDFIAQNIPHQHPRVRFAAFTAVGQVAYDHSPHVQETHCELLLPAIVAGIKDNNLRVAAEAVNALTAMAEDMSCDDLEPFQEDVITCLFTRLNLGETRAMQLSCLLGVAAVAEVMDELFLPYYSSVVPALKRIITEATGEKDRSLRGKAFECMSLVGSVVGKEAFAGDAHEVMKVMEQMVQSGFAPDDPQQESVRKAAREIAEALGKDFKPYVQPLLPVLFETLKQRPKEVDPADMPDDNDSDDEHPDMSLTVVDGKVLGLRTSTIDDMGECLELIGTFVEALEEDYCAFLPPTCQNLLPLLDLQLSETLQSKAFKTWEALVQCARNGVDQGLIEASTLQELVTVFLEKVLGALRDTAQSQKLDEETLRTVQAKVVGASGVIRKAGKGILTKDGVKSIAGLTGQLLSNVQCPKDQDGCADDVMHRRKGRASSDDDDVDEEEEEAATPDSLRFALADVAGALMHTSADLFAEVALQDFMRYVETLLKQGAPENDRGLAFYITDDVVDCLGLSSVPYWNGVLPLALQAINDKCATVRQYAASTIGNAAQHPIFAQMAPHAATAIHRLLQKQGERHRRRKAMKADAKQAALAVEASIRALGEVCEHHEATLGQNSGVAWDMWLTNLPLKYDEEAGQKAHTQLLRVVSKNHPVVSSPKHMQQVVIVLTEVYKTKFSNAALDSGIQTSLSSIAEASLTQLCSSLPEKNQKKVQHILVRAKASD